MVLPKYILSKFLFEMEICRSLISLVFLPVCFSLFSSELKPVNYCVKDESVKPCQSQISIYVNSLSSEESSIPYEFNDFDFCNVVNHSPIENLQAIFGERIRQSLFSLSFLEEKQCANFCQKIYRMDKKEDVDKLNTLKKGMLKNYQHHWIIDNMPVTWCYLVEGNQHFCSTGFPVGCYVNSLRQRKDACVMNTAFSQPDTFYLFNHVDICIYYHSGVSESWGVGFKDKGGRIVKVKILPRSIKHQPGKNCGNDLQPMAIPNQLKPTDIITVNYTYTVTFLIDNTIKWSSRYDYLFYESSPHTNIQWFSISNSLVLILFLTGLIVKIYLRTLRKAMVHCSEVNLGDKSQKQFWWNSVYGDVFRPPRCGMLLSVFLGSGVQVFFTAFITLVFACLEFFCPVQRNGWMMHSAISYICFGAPAGYVSARFYKAFGGEKWKTNIFLTATVCPGCVFCWFLVVNLIFWMKGSSSAIPFATLSALALWFVISIPWTFAGAYIGFKKHAIKYPVQTNDIPRQIPHRFVCTWSIPGIIMGGILPFGCIYVPFFFLLNNIWLNQFYMFGSLFLSFTILIIICSETTILLCYYHLHAEDYHWWWRSFLNSGFTAFYLFMYCIYYFCVKLNISDAASTFLYLGHNMVMAMLFFLLTGTVGFFACFWFVRKIYTNDNLKKCQIYTTWHENVPYLKMKT